MPITRRIGRLSATTFLGAAMGAAGVRTSPVQPTPSKRMGVAAGFPAGSLSHVGRTLRRGGALLLAGAPPRLFFPIACWSWGSAGPQQSHDVPQWAGDPPRG